MIKYVENNNLDEILTNELTIVDFFAEWCGPCKMMGSVLEDLQNEINIIKINTDSNTDLARSYGVMSIPTLIFMKDKQNIKEIIGFRDKDEILAIIKELS